MLTPLFAVFFGSPFTVLLTAAGAVALPIIIHLLNRKRYRVVPWAAMRFLLAAQKKNSRKLRIEQLILLLLRIFIVLLVVLAMASVAKWAEDLWAKTLPEGSLSGGSGKRTHRILVLDGSLSMGLRNGDTTCFEKARELATRIVQESPRGDGVSIVLMASSPRRVLGGTNGPAEDTARVVKELETLRLPHGNSDLAGTLETVRDLLGDKLSPAKFTSREVYFLTDLQKSTWAIPDPGKVSAALDVIGKRARTIFLDVGVNDPPRNYAVTSLGLAGDRLIAKAGEEVIFRATIRLYGDEPPEPVRLTLRVGQAALKSGDATFLRDKEGFAFTDHPQDPVKLSRVTTVSVKHRFATAGDYAVQLRVEGDALDLDDARSTILRVRESVPVLLVNGKQAADPYEQATEYLLDALNPYQDRKPPADAPLRPRKISAAQFADAGLSDLGGYDCVFLCDVPRLSAAEVKRLETHVLRGGGVVFCVGQGIDVDAYRDLLYRGGQGLLPARLLGRQRAPKGFVFNLAADDRDMKISPLAVFEKKESDRKNLFETPFFEVFRTETASGSPAPRRILSFATAPEKPEPGKPNESSAYERLAALLDWQPPLQREKDADAPDVPANRAPQAIPASRGRVALLTTTANTDWTDWPRKGSFVWLMQELVGHVASARLRGQSATVGDTLEEYLPNSGGDQKEVTVFTPDYKDRKDAEGSNTVRTTARDEAILWRWTDTDIAGIYCAKVGAHPREYLLAVNPPIAADNQQGGESDLSRIDEEELRKLNPDWDIQIVRDPGDARKGGDVFLPSVADQVPQLGSAVARWLLLLAFVFLVAEGILAWHFGHYSTVHERDTLTAPAAALRWLKPLLSVLVSLLGLFTLLAAFVVVHAVWTGDFLGFLPGSWRRDVEERMGVPEPAPGEGSLWNLEFQPYLRDAAADVWLAPLVGVLVAGLVIWLYRREGRVLTGMTNTRKRGALALMVGMRLGLLVVLLLILLPRLKLWIERQSWPDVVLLIDDSASMTEVDRFRDPRVQEEADRLARIAGLDKAQRLQLAQALLTRGDDWLTRLLNQRQVRVHVYRCSARSARLAAVTEPKEVENGLKEIAKLDNLPRNDTSQLGASLRQVLNDFRGSSLAAVVMLTDGVTTEGEEIVQAAKYAAGLHVPLFFVGIGDSHEARDIVVSDLEVADNVFVNDRLVFRFNVAARGYGKEVSTVKVRLREKDNDVPLRTEVVNVEPGGKKVRMEYQPTTPGEKTFIVDTFDQPNSKETFVRDDEADRENNRLERTVWVSETHTIKVLYVEGYGRWEFRYLKTLLERESARLKNNKTMELNFWLQDADPAFAPQDKSARLELPGKAELNKYHVVILGDVDPSPKDAKMTQFLKDLADFVRERGGGLVMLAGERYAPHTYKESPLRDVLPIDIVSDRPSDEPDGGRVEGYLPELTAMGKMHPIFSFNEKDGEPIFRKLREMYWHAEGYLPKRAAEVLAVHPTKKLPGGKEARLPLVVQHFVGEGRAMFLGFSETWRWRWREDEGRFNQFWIQTVRYLSRSHQGRVELRVDKPTYLRGDPIRVKVRFPDDDKPPPDNLEVSVLVLNRTLNERETLKLTRIEGSRATFEGTLTRTPEGRYDFMLVKPAVRPLPKTEARVLAPPGEMQRLQMNQADLEAAARETRGQFYNLADAHRLLDELPAGTRMTLHAPGPPWLLWNHWLVLLVVLLFLGVEWILRKRFNLL